MKPTLACDANLEKLKFPIVVLPKIDGVRGLNIDGNLVGRSLKFHKNKFTFSCFSFKEFAGFDGELYLGENGCDKTHPDLCRLTTSALNTINGAPVIKWEVFDYFGGDALNMGYLARLRLANQRLCEIYHSLSKGSRLAQFMYDNIGLCEYQLANNLEQLLQIEQDYLEQGYEGVILRDPHGKYKQGRCTVREGSYMRIKRFIESEAIVRSVQQGFQNNNEAQINELGLQFRSSHKENKTPNGLLATMECEVLETIYEPQTDKILFNKGDIVTVGAGKMDHAMRAELWNDHSLIIGKVIKWKFFPKGIKDEPRFPNFQSFKMTSDM